MTTPTERRLAITPGEAKMADGNRPWVNDSAGFCIADFGWDEDRDDRGNAEALANATLYADAHNTYNACHLTPSELLARLREVEVALLRIGQEGHCAPSDGGWDAATEYKTRRDIARKCLSTLNLPK